MYDKAKQIKEALEIYNTFVPENTESAEKTADSPLLIAKITNFFEAEFLASLCTAEAQSQTDIEFCVNFDNITKPIGFLSLTFDKIQTIHEYNPNIKIGLFLNNKFQLLTTLQEICLG